VLEMYPLLCFVVHCTGTCQGHQNFNELRLIGRRVVGGETESSKIGAAAGVQTGWTHVEIPSAICWICRSQVAAPNALAVGTGFGYPTCPAISYQLWMRKRLTSEAQIGTPPSLSGHRYCTSLACGWLKKIAIRSRPVSEPQL
jgi:hypothetical protein